MQIIGLHAIGDNLDEGCYARFRRSALLDPRRFNLARVPDAQIESQELIDRVQNTSLSRTPSGEDMPERPFTLCVVTKEDIRDAIRNAKTRLYYCLPGVDEQTATLLVEAYDRIPGTVYVHVDPSQQYSLDCGYGTQKGIDSLAAKEKAYIAKHWRLGLVIADDVAYIFTPTPESVEPPPKKGQEPNGVSLKGAEVEFLLAHILGRGNRPILSPQSVVRPNQPSLTSATRLSSKAGEEEANKIPTPKMKRLLNLVRRLFRIVRFQHSLTISDKRITLSPKELGFQTRDIDYHLKTSFMLLTDEDRNQIKKILKKADKFVNDSIRDGWIKSLHPYGYVVSYMDPHVLKENFFWLEVNLENEVRDWIKVEYDKIKKRSDNKVMAFLCDDVFPRVRPVRAPKHSGMTDEQFREDWVNEYAKKFEFPTYDKIIGSLRIGYDLYDISEELLGNKDFRERLEFEFEVDLDRLQEIEES